LSALFVAVITGSGDWDGEWVLSVVTGGVAGSILSALFVAVITGSGDWECCD
jgi:hypothetical protein